MEESFRDTKLTPANDSKLLHSFSHFGSSHQNKVSRRLTIPLTNQTNVALVAAELALSSSTSIV